MTNKGMRFIPTKYELRHGKAGAGVFLHAEGLSKRGSGIENIRSASGNGVKAKTLESLRKHAKSMAKFHKVPFEETRLD